MKIKSPINILFILILLHVLVISCNDNQNDQKRADLDSKSAHGSIAFNIDLKRSSKEVGADVSAASANSDICIDYNIEKINATVYESNQQAVASESWPCNLHRGDITGVSAGQGYRIVIEGMVGKNIHWRGEKTDIQVVAEEAVHAGVIMVRYIGDDRDPPEILSHTPLSGANDVPTDTDIQIVFSEDIVVTSVNIDNVYLAENDTTIGARVSYDAATRVATLTPDSALLHDNPYTVHLTAGLKDLSGNNAREYSWQFTTVDKAGDQSPPKILSHAPLGNSNNVPVDTTIKITFNEDVAGVSINADNVYLANDDGPIGGQVSYDETTRTAIFTP